MATFANFLSKSANNSAIFNENFEIGERCKGVHCVDLGESFPTSIYLQNLASIQPRTSPFKFARSPRTDPPGVQISNFSQGASNSYFGEQISLSAFLVDQSRPFRMDSTYRKRAKKIKHVSS